MSSYYGNQNSNRHVDAPRHYRVRLSRFGSHSPGDYKPSPLTIFVSATSSMQARTSHPDYTVTDVMES